MTAQVEKQWSAGRFARRAAPLVLTAVIFYLIFQRVPFHRFISALGDVDYPVFLAIMVPNAIVFVFWDTFILAVAIRWFHGAVPYRALLPLRAASYIVAIFNTNAARGALAAFVSRVLDRPFLQIGSTVIFLVLTEYTHLVAWATIGIVAFGSELTRPFLWVPPAAAGVWLLFFAYARTGRTFEQTTAPSVGVVDRVGRIIAAPWRGALLRTFRIAPAASYVKIVLLRAPMFFVSLCLHYFAARVFGLEIPFGMMLAFLPVIFMAAALPITVARLGTTQAAWILLFSSVAPAEHLLAFSLAAHLTFALTRAAIGILLLPRTYHDLLSPQGTFSTSVAFGTGVAFDRDPARQ